MVKYIQTIQKMMMKEHISIDEMAKQSGINKRQIQMYLEEKKEPSFEELVKIATILHLNINDLLELQINNNADFAIQDELELEINRVARRIPQEQRGNFVKAVTYLAECFDKDKDE